MAQQVLPGMHRIGVPLPGNPLKELNAWLFMGTNRHLLVDNGFNMPEAEMALRKSLEKLEVDADELDFFITHLHADHNGLTGALASKNAQIMIGRVDGAFTNDYIEKPELWHMAMGQLAGHGFPQEAIAELTRTHPGRIYANRSPLPFTFVEEGDELAYGNYRLRVISTPGHTPGHMTLFEPDKKFLVSGDHILGAITPNITSWIGVQDSLGDYLQSLRKVDALGAGVSWPGHRAIVPDTHKRIGELQAHHKRRLAEAAKITRHLGEAQAWDVAAKMEWNLRGTWPDYRIAQKCFAVGEAVAHLDHLAVLGELEKTVTQDGHTLYRG